MIVKHGATRLVFFVGKYAFKFPSAKEWRLFLHGLLANMQEVVFSKAGWPELCPVLFHLPLGLMVVMPRCQPLTEEDYKYLIMTFFVSMMITF